MFLKYQYNIPIIIVIIISSNNNNKNLRVFLSVVHSWRAENSESSSSSSSRRLFTLHRSWAVSSEAWRWLATTIELGMQALQRTSSGCLSCLHSQGCDVSLDEFQAAFCKTQVREAEQQRQKAARSARSRRLDVHFKFCWTQCWVLFLFWGWSCSSWYPWSQLETRTSRDATSKTLPPNMLCPWILNAEPRYKCRKP